MKLRIAALVVYAACAVACSGGDFRPLPSEAQLAWQEMEYNMFCHFGPNTFTGREWGLGDEDPDIFNPTNLDCDQWVRTAIAAGMKGIIITAKHHDGFCLWPSAYSTHTVAQSNWRGGEGDVLRELREACDAHDFPMGAYVSPWDRNHPAYGSERYNEIFAGTVDEVNSRYGPLFEQWFDGANGGARIPDYDWPLFNSTVLRHNPDAVIFSDVGPGCRWVGNEAGRAGETNWCTITVDGFTPGAGAPPTEVLNCGSPDGTAWVPAECDVPLRDGWFDSSANEGTQKSVEQLMEIWFSSVGRGANLLLNVAPDHTGRIPQADSLRLMEFKAARDAYFAKPLASAYGSRSAFRLFSARTSKTLRTDAPAKCIVLQEELRHGQNISSFRVEARRGGAWETVAEGTTVGHKRILRFENDIPAGAFRVVVDESFARPRIKSITIY